MTEIELWARIFEDLNVEELNARLDEAEAADEADELTAHEEVMRKAYQYLATL